MQEVVQESLGRAKTPFAGCADALKAAVCGLHGYSQLAQLYHH